MNILLDVDARPVVAHRGNSAHAPENTLEAFRQAVELGADALELDLRLTRDGAAVVMHDALVDRTTDGRGAVAAMSLTQMRSLDAGAAWTDDGGRTRPYRGRGIGVPTLEEVLVAFPRVPLVLEIKTAAVAAETRRVLEAHGDTARCVVDAFDPAALVAFRGSSIPLGATRRDVARLIPGALAHRRPRALPYRALFIPPRYRGLRLPIGALARAARAAGATTHVWTVNHPAAALRLWRSGVCGIISDDPAAILAARDGVGVNGRGR